MPSVTTCAANVSPAMRDAAKPALDKEGLTMSEYLRLCIAYLGEHGKAPFAVPDNVRNLPRRAGALKKSAGATFFG